MESKPAPLRFGPRGGLSLLHLGDSELAFGTILSSPYISAELDFQTILSYPYISELDFGTILRYP